MPLAITSCKLDRMYPLVSCSTLANISKYLFTNIIGDKSWLASLIVNEFVWPGNLIYHHIVCCSQLTRDCFLALPGLGGLLLTCQVITCSHQVGMGSPSQMISHFALNFFLHAIESIMQL